MQQNNKDVSSRVSPPTDFFVAAQLNDLDTLKIYLTPDYDINAQLEYGTYSVTGLITACIEGTLDVVSLLIKHGADVNRCSTLWHRTPLHCAVKRNYTEIVKCLVDNGADVNALDRDGMSPFLQSCERDQVEITRYLLDNGAAINQMSHGEGLPVPVRRMRDNRRVPICQYQDAAEMYKSSSGLMKAVLHQRIDTVIELIQRGCDVKQTNLNGNTALQMACKRGFVDIVDAFLVYAPRSSADVIENDCLLIMTIKEIFESLISPTKEEGCSRVAEKLIDFGAKLQSGLLFHVLFHNDSIFPRKDKLRLRLLRLILAISPSISNIWYAELLGRTLDPLCYDDAFNDMLLALDDVNKIVRSLQHHCRCVLRSSLGYSIQQKVSSLYLPQRLRDFVCLTDFLKK